MMVQRCLKIAFNLYLDIYEKGEGGRFGLGLSIVSKVCKANHYIVKGENSEDGVRFIIYRKTKKQKKKKII